MANLQPQSNRRQLILENHHLPLKLLFDWRTNAIDLYPNLTVTTESSSQPLWLRSPRNSESWWIWWHSDFTQWTFTPLLKLGDAFCSTWWTGDLWMGFNKIWRHPLSLQAHLDESSTLNSQWTLVTFTFSLRHGGARRLILWITWLTADLDDIQLELET